MDFAQVFDSPSSIFSRLCFSPQRLAPWVLTARVAMQQPVVFSMRWRPTAVRTVSQAPSITWGPWEQGAAASALVTKSEPILAQSEPLRIPQTDMRGLSFEEGLKLFDIAHESGEELVIAVPLDMAALRIQAKEGTALPVLRGLVRKPTRRVSSSGAGSSLAKRLASMSDAERAVVLGMVQAEVGIVLGYVAAEAVDEQRTFKDLGFDSTTAVELRNRLAAATALQLPATLIFDYPTSVAVAEHLVNELSGNWQRDHQRVRGGYDQFIRDSGDELSGYFQGIRSPEELWNLVANGGDGISAFPTDRGWDLESLYDPESRKTSHAREGGFLYNAGDFDAEFFGVGPREALAMDPQQRLLLEAALEALEEYWDRSCLAAWQPERVFAGVIHHDYGMGLPVAV